MSTVDETQDQLSKPASVEAIRPSRTGRRLRLDEHGHLIPRTESEKVEDHKALLAAFARMAAIPDDPPGSDEALFRAIDEARPERPLFREFYEP
jgi:hypothetical protein